MADDGRDFHSQVLDWVAGMTEKQFVEFFYRAVRAQRSRHSDEEEARFVLADGSDGEQPTFIALHDDEQYPSGFADDAPLCQFGTCDECGADVLSVAKHALCPLCGARVYCT